MGRRLVGPALLLAVCACTAVLDFDPVGLPCETDEHCPSPTRCGPDGECVGGAADGGGGPDVPAEGEGEGDRDVPSVARVVSERDVSDLGAPVGLAGPEDGEGPLWTADFIEDRLVTVPDGDVLCSLPDTGVRAVARVGGAALTLHASGLFRVVVEGCASERLATWESAGSDLAYEGGELLELDGREVRIRAPDTAAQQGRWALEDAPSELERLAVEDGLLLLPEPTSVAGGFHVVLHVFDAARGAASARAVARLELPIDASAVRGAYAAGDRLWLLTGGSGSQAARLVEVVLE